jgi:hypothetical protein
MPVAAKTEPEKHLSKNWWKDFLSAEFRVE